MTLTQLLFRNLIYHWRGNSTVMFGVAVGTAVLTGALLIGDSLRGSLRDLTLEQLGWVQHSLVSGRFIREQLAAELGVEQLAPAIFLRGAATHGSADTPGGSVRRVGQVAILGINARFWNDGKAADVGDFWDSEKREVVLNAALANDLGVAAGGQVTLHLQKVSEIARETPFGRRGAGDTLSDLLLTVHGVVPNEGLGRFSLNPNPAVARIAFLPLRLLQARLQQSERVNAILVGATDPAALQSTLRSHLTLDDWGLILRTPKTRTQEMFRRLGRGRDRIERNQWRQLALSFAQAADRNHDGVLEPVEVEAYFREHHNYLSLESRQLLLDRPEVAAALEAARATNLRAAPTLVYLATSIAAGKKSIP